jgi:hypothetical protein
MIEQLGQAVRWLNMGVKISDRYEERTVKYLKGMESCILKYKRALIKVDKSAMRQLSAEVHDIMHAFKERPLLVIDTEREKNYSMK